MRDKNRETNSVRSRLGTAYDRQMRVLNGLPGVVSTKVAPIRHHEPVLEFAQTFTVQTFRERDTGDWVFLEYIDNEGSMRVALPPAVCDCIARQRDSLTTKTRKRAAKAEAARRKAAGIKPGFLKVKKAEGE